MSQRTNASRSPKPSSRDTNVDTNHDQDADVDNDQDDMPRLTEEYLAAALRAAASPPPGADTVVDADPDPDPTLKPPEPEKGVPDSKRKRGRPGQRGPAQFGKYDPFDELELLNETGNIDGQTKRMRPAQMAALREYCLIDPSKRTLRALQAEIAEHGGKPPSFETLKDWHEKYHWEALLSRYDSTLYKSRLAVLEAERRDADRRHAQVGRHLQQIASVQIARIVSEYNEPQRPLTDAKGNVIINPRTGKPLFPPKKTLAGIQGLAVTYKIAVESERVALGMPTVVTNERVQSETTNTNVNLNAQVQGTITLEEWRQRSATDRGLYSGAGGGGAGSDGNGMVRATGGGLQPPAAQERARALPAAGGSSASGNTAFIDPDGLSAADLDALPEDWLPDAPGMENVVDADPPRSPSQGSDDDSDDDDDDDTD